MKPNKKFEILMVVWTVFMAVVLIPGSVFVVRAYVVGTQNEITDDEEEEDEVLDIATGTSVIPANTPDPYENQEEKGNEEDYKDDENPDLKDASYAYATTVVNVRSSSSMTADVIGKLETGQKVEILEYGSQWIYIDAGNVKGYVRAFYLSLTKPEPTKAPDQQATAAPRQETVATKKPQATKKPEVEKPKATKKPKVTKEPEVEKPVVTEKAAATEAPANNNDGGNSGNNGNSGNSGGNGDNGNSGNSGNNGNNGNSGQTTENTPAPAGDGANNANP